METDRELLEFAAKASGLDGYFASDDQSERDEYWDPLTNDGDAFRLAVNIGIAFRKIGNMAMVIGLGQHDEYINDDACAATRRAIVRAAAEIGRK